MNDPVPSSSALPPALVHQADQNALDAARRSGARNVALLVSSPVICAGLEVLLHRLPNIGTVLVLEPGTPHTAFSPGSLDVLIVASEQWHLLKDAAGDEEHPLPHVLVLGEPVQDHRRVEFVNLPSNGFLSLHDLSEVTLHDAMERSLAGEIPMPATLARELLGMHRLQLPRSAVRPVTLTPRENETLHLMAGGMSNKQIARALTISTHGAKRLVGSVLAKFDAPNRTAAVTAAIDAGLV